MNGTIHIAPTINPIATVLRRATVSITGSRQIERVGGLAYVGDSSMSLAFRIAEDCDTHPGGSAY